MAPAGTRARYCRPNQPGSTDCRPFDKHLRRFLQTDNLFDVALQIRHSGYPHLRTSLGVEVLQEFPFSLV